ncbi:hypothetical protein Tco_0051103, partial [Tanacetum coccineum]
MKNPNPLNEPNEAIPEENPVIPDPNHVVDVHDPNEMVDIPDDDDLVDYDPEEEDPKEDPEEESESNDGLVNQFAPHVDPHQSSEDEEADVAPEETVGTVTQRPFAASRGRSRVTEAELGTCQTEIALLKSKNKIGEKEREILDHDLGNVEHVLGNVLERLKVLESGENATLKKRLTDTKIKLDLTRMERDSFKRRLLESIGWNRRFYLEMVRIGAVPKPSSDDEGTERPRKKSKKSSFDGTKGPFKPHGPPS